MAYFKLDRFHKHGTGIRRTECESLHVAIDAVAVQPLRIYGISALQRILAGLNPAGFDLTADVSYCKPCSDLTHFKNCAFN